MLLFGGRRHHLRLARLPTGQLLIPKNEVLISVAALWELTIRASSGKLSLPVGLETMVASQGFAVLSITFPHLTRLAGLPRLHRDPFDRIIIAQGLAEGIPIATGDRFSLPTVCRSFGNDRQLYSAA
jgi:PIN domain nuclease of toxin-antitoxin system